MWDDYCLSAPAGIPVIRVYLHDSFDQINFRKGAGKRQPKQRHT